MSLHKKSVYGCEMVNIILHKLYTDSWAAIESRTMVTT